MPKIAYEKQTLAKREVLAVVGLNHRQLDRLVAEENFPAPVVNVAYRQRWNRRAVQRWIDKGDPEANHG